MAEPNKEVVEFKSLPEFFEKEKFGSKCNTVRKLPIGDEREDKLRRWASLVDYGQIAITNTETKESILRNVTDVTIWQGVIIISWKHPSYEPEKRWLKFIDISNPEAKTKKLMVKNKENECGLGNILWDIGWRQYVFDDGIIKMAEGCEFEVFEKIKQLREEREKLKEVK